MEAAVNVKRAEDTFVPVRRGARTRSRPRPIFLAPVTSPTCSEAHKGSDLAPPEIDTADERQEEKIKETEEVNVGMTLREELHTHRLNHKEKEREKDKDADKIQRPGSRHKKQPSFSLLLGNLSEKFRGRPSRAFRRSRSARGNDTDSISPTHASSLKEQTKRRRAITSERTAPWPSPAFAFQQHTETTFCPHVDCPFHSHSPRTPSSTTRRRSLDASTISPGAQTSNELISSASASSSPAPSLPFSFSSPTVQKSQRGSYRYQGALALDGATASPFSAVFQLQPSAQSASNLRTYSRKLFPEAEDILGASSPTSAASSSSSSVTPPSSSSSDSSTPRSIPVIERDSTTSFDSADQATAPSSSPVSQPSASSSSLSTDVLAPPESASAITKKFTFNINTFTPLSRSRSLGDLQNHVHC
ncbi:hypothetical protein QOT17_019226 [Balamuthia mandrillaris]